jgi:alpha-1,6-mannosyltransferase
MNSLQVSLATSGALYLASTVVLAFTRAPLGSPLFFACAGAGTIAYGFVLWRFSREHPPQRRILIAALLISIAIRAPLAGPRANSDSDMARYLWDGRVQTLGYSPYEVVPADPALAATHTDETQRMPSARTRTPYPPGAQLFFRLVVSLRDSIRAMKTALVACDLMTALILWRWLALTGRPEWLVLSYAWNPLVVLEIAHSGHLDALGAMWIAASAYWLARRRTALASIAYVLAVATKLLPIVLLPLYWRRVKLRDAAAGATVLALLYLSYTRHGALPLGNVPNVVDHIRFNGPVFRLVAGFSTSQAAAIAAVGLGLAAAAWARWRLDANNPAAWIWPMAIALAAAPVIYPWYLLYLTPFLFTLATLPIALWTITVIPVYIVWQLAAQGAQWVVPSAVMRWEYGIPLAVGIYLAWRRSQNLERTNPAEPSRTLQNPVETVSAPTRRA